MDLLSEKKSLSLKSVCFPLSELLDRHTDTHRQIKLGEVYQTVTINDIVNLPFDHPKNPLLLEEAPAVILALLEATLINVNNPGLKVTLAINVGTSHHGVKITQSLLTACIEKIYISLNE